MLRSAGHESDIFAELVHPRVAHLARPLHQSPPVSGPDSVCIFHFSIGSAAGRLIHHAPDRLVVVYHNITPAHFFLGFHPHLAGLCHHGRRELAAFAPRTELALGDSEFNRQELEQAGFRRTGVLPIALDLSLYERAPSPLVRRLYDDGRTNVLFVGRIIPNRRYRRPGAQLRLLPEAREAEEPPAAGRRLPGLRALLRPAAGAGARAARGRGRVHRPVDDDELYAYYRLADVFLCLSEHEGFGVPLVEAMLFGLPVVAYDAGAVRETLRGGGLLLNDKSRSCVAEVLDQVTHGGNLRRAVVASQQRAAAAIRATDFGALVLDRLRPVLDGTSPATTAHPGA